jgi:hypothetical protein
MNVLRLLTLASALGWLPQFPASGANPSTTPRRIQEFTPRPAASEPGTNASPLLHQTLDGRTVQSWIKTNVQSSTVHLFTIHRPSVSQPRYAVTGEVSYVGVEGEGFLEMWSHFQPAQPGLPSQRAFSRTLARSGRLGRISGSSGWRGFELPMDATGATGSLSHLELNLTLSGTGTVHVGPLTLVEYPDAWPWSDAGRSTAWWGSREGGIIGGLGGATLGILGGTFGWLAGRGRARGLVMAGMRGLIATGSICLVAGGAAYVQSQPYAVWYPLVLTGILSVAILPFGLRQMHRQYEARELQKIRAADTLSD